MSRWTSSPAHRSTTLSTSHLLVGVAARESLIPGSFDSFGIRNRLDYMFVTRGLEQKATGGGLVRSGLGGTRKTRPTDWDTYPEMDSHEQASGGTHSRLRVGEFARTMRAQRFGTRVAPPLLARPPQRPIGTAWRRRQRWTGTATRGSRRHHAHDVSPGLVQASSAAG